MVTPHSVFGSGGARAAQAGDTTQIRAVEHTQRLRAANALRRIARDEALKAKAQNDPLLAPLLQRAAQRYIGGTDLAQCIQTVKRINAQGHAATADYMGESTRDEAHAAAETEHFLALVRAIDHEQLNCTVSLDLSHIGLTIDADLGVANATCVCQAAHEIGREVMISMEGSERTDAIFKAHEKLCQRFDHVGITVQARMHRSEADLPTLLKRPGRIRLVKGAYDEAEDVAHPRISEGTTSAFRSLTRLLLESGNACSIGTHDWRQLAWAQELLTSAAVGKTPAAARSFEFETLLGLGPEQSDHMRGLGHPTRQYVVYGNEWFLYVCHRIAEDPPRLYDALADIGGMP
jgi:proline dehydrogenase